LPRVKRGVTAHRRHKRLLRSASGYFQGRHRLWRTANEARLHALAYAYRDRRSRKRDFRQLWITRINAAARLSGMSYSRLMNGLHVAGVTINRKMLADLAVHDAGAFRELVATAQAALGRSPHPGA
jgi:large subunit ribosomal protein L20